MHKKCINSAQFRYRIRVQYMSGMLPYQANFTGCDALMVRTDLHMAGYAKEIVLALVPTVVTQGMDNILGLSQPFQSQSLL